MKGYTRLTLAEREEVSRALAASRSLRRIAHQLRRSPSAISRELCRTGSGGCAPAGDAIGRPPPTASTEVGGPGTAQSPRAGEVAPPVGARADGQVVGHGVS